MASSTSPSSPQRRHAHQRRQQLTRSDSSFLSTIKSIVTAPLAWLSGNDGFDDFKGKRRRPSSPSEPTLGDEGASRTKRMRVDSPPIDVEKPQTLHSRSTPYLDPPSHIFKQQRASEQHAQSIPRSSSLSISTSTIQPYSSNTTTTATNNVRSTLSPLRNLGISRTMSVDPPTRTLRRESAMANIPVHRDVSFENTKSLPRSPSLREHSMPLIPQSTRPSFRITPQPSAPPVQRESSEPPPLSSLIINPVFVRAPSAQPPDFRQHSAANQTVTLGSLADLSRSVRSPVRQHSSLLSSISQSSDTHTLRQQLPAEKALHELDIYKTPLLPSRLRLSAQASQFASSAVPDLFKPRRSQKLILMHDGRRTGRFGAKVVDSGKVPLANDTKPYAGEGGMKKLLARRKLEIETDGEQSQGEQENTKREETRMSDESQAGQSIKSDPSPESSRPKVDWFAVASGVDRPSNLVSSLRVGREKKRHHIVRPKAKPGKSKFSAAFDEDLDEVMDEGIDEVEGEKTAKEELPSKAFVFCPPPGFTLIQNSPQFLRDSDDTKELPIPSLPFSLTEKSQDVTNRLAKPGHPLSVFPAGIESTSTSIPKINTSSPGPTDAKSAVDLSGKSVPNFFASSKVLSKPINISVPPLDFKLASTRVTAEPATSTISDSTSTDTSITTETELFVPTKRGNTSITSSLTTSVPTVREVTSSTTAQSLSVPTTPSVMDIKSASTMAHTTSVDPVSQSSMTVIQPKGTIETTDSMSTDDSQPAGESVIAPQSSSAMGSSLATNHPTSVGHDFMSASKNAVDSASNSSEVTKPPPPRGSSGFASPAVGIEPYKPTFGSTGESTVPKPSFNGFSFHPTPSVANKSQNQPSDGLIITPGTTVGQTEQKKVTSIFTFDTPQPSTPAPTSTNLFSFGGGGTVASDVSKPFTFGTSTTSPVTSLERPITPPRVQDQEVRMEESPTRDVQSSEVKSATPGFPFGQTTTSNSLFGTQAQGNVATASPFAFGASQSLASNAFATSVKETKPNQDKATVFSQSPSFSFGQNNKVSGVGGAIQSPTNGPFSFGSSASTFTFGGQGSNNPFGQPQADSAPSSPSTFGTSFSFLAPASNTGFAFGSSQPSSPVGGTNLSLPPPSTSTGFGNTGFGQSTPSSPFTASSPLTPSAPGGPLFTIGSAPTVTPGGLRQIKKLPTRRGGMKR
ncbi:hypothetical protein AX15_005038 [Amanita polypyramis BW_CC]|nr:hypothetical protein AX15_005038 [Amanita polypyramis BW_CC]